MSKIRNFIEKTHPIVHGAYTIIFRSLSWAAGLMVAFPIDTLKISKEGRVIGTLIFLCYLCIMDKLERNRTKTLVDVNTKISGKDLTGILTRRSR